MEITAQTPKWAEAANASPTEQKKWVDWSDGLMKHEQGHINIDKQGATDRNAALVCATASGTGKTRAEAQANGKAREMFVLALAKIRQPSSIETLISLLNDDQVAGHAVMALRKAKAPEAMDCLEPFTRHPQSWVRYEAKKAIANLMKAHPPKLGA